MHYKKRGDTVLVVVSMLVTFIASAFFVYALNETFLNGTFFNASENISVFNNSKDIFISFGNQFQFEKSSYYA